ncbi:MAG TPA: VOC family protein, partial [Leptolyngbyaceae cyanobacterium]
ETELVLRPAQAPWKGGACTRVPLRTRVGRKGLLPLLPAPFPPASSGQTSETSTPPPDGKLGVIFTLVTQQVDEWYEYLKKLGVEFEKPPTLNEKYNIYHCFLRDPNGYLIEIQRFN